MKPYDPKYEEWLHTYHIDENVEHKIYITTYDVRMALFDLKIAKLSHIRGARASQDLRSPSPTTRALNELLPKLRPLVWL